MHAFNYHRPSNVNDAAAQAAKSADAKVLAGGQSLVQAMKLRLSAPTDIIDLGMLKELADRVEVDEIARRRKPQLHRLHQALPAGEKPALAFLRREVERLLAAGRTVIFEGIHRSFS